MRRLVFIITLIFSSTVWAVSGVTYHGRIMRSGGTPVDGQFVGFRVRVMDGNTGSCEMYQETRTKDMRNTQGTFSIVIGDGTVVGTYNVSGASYFDDIFQNNRTFNFIAPAGCVATPYTPDIRDGRVLNVQFRESPSDPWEDLPPMTVAHVPFAYNALLANQVGSHTSASLLRVENAGTPQSISALTPANYTTLMSILGGSYISAVSGTAGQITASTSAGTATVGLADVSGVTPATYGSASTVPVFTVDQKGRVTGVSNVAISGVGTAITALTGDVTASGSGSVATTISANAVTTAKIADGSVTLAKLASDAVGTANIADGSVTLAKLASDSVNSAKIVDGSIVGADISSTAALSVASIAATGNVAADTMSTNGIALYELPGNGTNYLMLKAADNMAANLTLKWPAADGASGQVLATDGSGNLTWQAASTGSITSLTGDVVASGAGAVVATIASDSVSFAKMQNINTNKLLGRSTAASGDIEELSIGTGLSLASGALSSTALMAVSNTATLTNGKFWIGDGSNLAQEKTINGDLLIDNLGSAAIQAKVVSFAKIQDITDNRILGRSAGSNGSMQELTLGTGLNLAAGVLTATGSDTFAGLPCGNGYVPYKTAGAWACKEVASINTADAIVTRDASGNYVAGTGTFNTAVKITDGSGGGQVTLSAPVAFTSYALKLPSADGSSNQVLKTDGSGNLGWATNGGGDFKADGTVQMTGNIRLNGHYLSGDGGNEGLTIDSLGNATFTGTVKAGSGTSATGIYSVATGVNTLANGSGSVAFNSGTIASGLYTFAAGEDTVASGRGAASFGYSSTAAGQYSASFGRSNAIGDSSFSAGIWTTADSLQQATFGAYNLPIGGENPTAWVTTDPLFVIGNGTGSGASRSTAVMVLKNGNVGIGTISPTTKMQVNGSLIVGDGNETCSGGNFTGAIRYNGGNLQFCNGTSWSSLGVAGAGITALTGDVTASGSGSVAATIANDAVTFAKMQNINTNKLLGRSTAASGDVEELSIGTGLSLASGALSSTALMAVSNTATLTNGKMWIGDGSNLAQEKTINGDLLIDNLGSAAIQAKVVSFAKIQDITDNRILGRSAGSNGSMQELTLGTGLSLASGVLSATASAPSNASYAVKGIVQFDTDAATSGISVASGIAKLASSGVSAATYGSSSSIPVATVDGFGRITAVTDTPIGINASQVTAGILPIARGGTNSGTALNNNRIMVSNGSAIVEAPAMTDGQLLIGATGSNPKVASLTAGTGVTITPAAGGITIAASGTGISALTGDVLASGSGSVIATIASDAVSFAKMQNISTNTILGRSTAASGDIEELSIGTGLSLASGTLSFSGSDTFAGLPCGDGYVPYKTAGAWACKEVASINTVSTIVTRDVSGNFVAGTGTFNTSVKITDGAAGGQVTLSAPAAFTSYALKLPTADGSSNQVLKTDGSGNLGWVTASSGSGDFKADGTVPMTGSLKMGGNTVYGNSTSAGNLTLESTSDATKGYVILQPTSGYVGVGTTTPGEALVVKGNSANGWIQATSSANSYHAGFQIAPTGAYSGSNHLWMFGRYGGTDDMRIWNWDGSTDTYNFTFKADGKVGVGTTSPNGKFDVKGSIVMSGSTSGYTGFQPAAAAGSTIWTLPSADGTSGQVLKTDGSGILSWVTASSGAGDFMKDGSVSMTGTLKAVPGSAALPGYTFAGDPDTGMSAAASDTLAFSTGGTQRATINSSGNMSIGTTSTNARLHVRSAGAVGTTFNDILYGDDSTGQFNGVRIRVKDGIADFGADYSGGTPATNVTFSTRPSGGGALAERMRIDGSGNVAIGTTTPAGLLDVASGTGTPPYPLLYVHSNPWTVTASFDQAKFYAVYNGTGANSGTLTGINNVIASGSSLSTTELFGIQNYLTPNHSGGATTTAGTFNWVRSSAASGTMANVYGTKNLVEGMSTGVITKAYGDYVKINNSGGGIATGYGVYIDTIAGTSNYGLYQASATNNNYFAGNVGIATATPTEKLEVTGNILATAYLYSSDERLKKDIQIIPDSLAKILTLKGVTYNWRAPASAEDRLQQLGVIAQDVEKVFPEAVRTSSNGIKRVNYPSLVAPLIEAVKDLYARILALTESKADREEVQILRNENEQLKKRLDEMQMHMQEIEKKVNSK